jgi:hypothetical protein
VRGHDAGKVATAIRRVGDSANLCLAVGDEHGTRFTEHVRPACQTKPEPVGEEARGGAMSGQVIGMPRTTIAPAVTQKRMNSSMYCTSRRPKRGAPNCLRRPARERCLRVRPTTRDDQA